MLIFCPTNNQVRTSATMGLIGFAFVSLIQGWGTSLKYYNLVLVHDRKDKYHFSIACSLSPVFHGSQMM